MTLVRASGTLTKPWSLATNRLDTAFGESTGEADTQTWRNTSRIYTLELTADRSTGTVKISVSTQLPYTLIVAGVILLVLLTTVTTTGPHTTFVALFVSLLVYVFPLIPGVIHYQRLYQHLPGLLNIQDARITPAIAAPLVGYLLCMWLLATSHIYQLLTLLLTGTLIPSTVYAIGYAPEGLRQQFPALLFAFFSGIPLLLTAGNFVLLRIATERLTTHLLIACIGILTALTVIHLAVYAYLCRIFVTKAHDIPNQPISSRPARALWFGYFTILNLLCLLFISTLLSDFWWFDSTSVLIDSMMTTFRASGVPYPTIATAVSIGILALPLIAVVVLWVVHLRRELRQYRRIRTGTTTADIDASEYPIRIIDSPRPVAFVAPLSPIRSTIVISSTLRDELTRDELQAVIAHEEYHIRNRDPVWNNVSTIFGFVIGGRNVLTAAYDYPQVEQEADLYAANQHGADTLIRALRTVEQLQTATPQQSTLQFNSAGRFTNLTWLLKAPYRVLFGSLVLANAHASIDERAETILAATSIKHTTN